MELAKPPVGDIHSNCGNHLKRKMLTFWSLLPTLYVPLSIFTVCLRISEIMRLADPKKQLHRGVVQSRAGGCLLQEPRTWAACRLLPDEVSLASAGVGSRG